MPDSVHGNLGAGGVTAEISRAANALDAAIAFTKGETEWDEAAAVAEAAIEITGWSETAVVNADTDPTERIVAYTNIASAVATAFHTVKGPAPYMVADEVVAPGQTTADRLPGPGTQLTLMDDAESDDVDESMFEGSLGGATGMFTCLVDSCTLTRGMNDTDGDPTWMLSGGWGFTANDGQNIEVPDSDYLAFGYWNKIDTERTLADFVPFYYGSMPYSGNVQALSGSATYTGNAAGGYEHNTYDTTTGDATPTYGHFTADVTLAAFFGGEDGMSTIDGLVNGFESQSGGPSLATWMVPLMRTEVTGQTFEGDTTGGTWSGAFFGPSDEGQLPSGVAGQFSATVGTGGVVGAYGATTTP